VMLDKRAGYGLGSGRPVFYGVGPVGVWSSGYEEVRDRV